MQSLKRADSYSDSYSDSGSGSDSDSYSDSGSDSGSDSSDNDHDVAMGKFIPDPDARLAFGFDEDDDVVQDIPVVPRTVKIKPNVSSALLAPKGSMNYIQLLPLPPVSKAIVKPNPILGSNSDNGFFTLATIIFHAHIDTESSLHRREKFVRTVKCPKNMRIISKTNIGFYENEHGFFPRTLLNILRNQRTASDMIKETGYISMVTIDYQLSKKKTEIATPAFEQDFKQTYPDISLTDVFKHIEYTWNQIRELIKKTGIEMLEKINQAAPPNTFEQITYVLDFSDVCNRLISSTLYSVSHLFETDMKRNQYNKWVQHPNVDIERSKYAHYGKPKTRYIPTKKYNVNSPVNLGIAHSDVTNTDNDDAYMVHHVEGKLHLAVNLRLDGRSYNSNININIAELARIASFVRHVTLDQMVKLIMDPALRLRVVDLICEQYVELTQHKEAMITLLDDKWNVAIFDGGCSGLSTMHKFPINLHLPSLSTMSPGSVSQTEVRGPSYGPVVAGPNSSSDKRKYTRRSHRNRHIVMSANPVGNEPPAIQTIRLKKMSQYLSKPESKWDHPTMDVFMRKPLKSLLQHKEEYARGYRSSSESAQTPDTPSASLESLESSFTPTASSELSPASRASPTLRTSGGTNRKYKYRTLKLKRKSTKRMRYKYNKYNQTKRYNTTNNAENSKNRKYKK